MNPDVFRRHAMASVDICPYFWNLRNTEHSEQFVCHMNTILADNAASLVSRHPTLASSALKLLTTQITRAHIFDIAWTYIKSLMRNIAFLILTAYHCI